MRGASLHEADSLNRVQFTASSQQDPHNSTWISDEEDKNLSAWFMHLAHQLCAHNFSLINILNLCVCGGVLWVLSTWGLLLWSMVCSLLDSGLQTFNLFVIIGPLGHNPHRSLQLGLLGHRVVTLKSGEMKMYIMKSKFPLRSLVLNCLICLPFNTKEQF